VPAAAAAVAHKRVVAHVTLPASVDDDDDDDDDGDDVGDDSALPAMVHATGRPPRRSNMPKSQAFMRWMF
jgi:hypothetical protein